MISLTPKGNKWEVEEDYQVSVLNTTIKIKKGFVSDLASIPRIMWVIFPPFGRYTEASVVHDYLYSTSEMKRKQCDNVFFALMIENNVNYVTAKIMYYAVRLFGWMYY